MEGFMKVFCITITHEDRPCKAFRELWKTDSENGRRFKTRSQKPKTIYSRKTKHKGGQNA